MTNDSVARQERNRQITAYALELLSQKVKDHRMAMLESSIEARGEEIISPLSGKMG